MSAPGCAAKNAATSAMSAGLNCAAIAFMTWFLRVPSFNAFNCASRYPARCDARLGMVSLTLTPLAPWHAPQTVAALALPASMSAACASGAQARTTDIASTLFIWFLPWLTAPARGWWLWQ